MEELFCCWPIGVALLFDTCAGLFAYSLLEEEEYVALWGELGLVPDDVIAVAA